MGMPLQEKAVAQEQTCVLLELENVLLTTNAKAILYVTLGMAQVVLLIIVVSNV